ncbi:MAG TPA: hypothetical protein PKA28_13550 [Methylomusa anaerophila]|uniref:Trimeric coiled-coil oligomerisation domain of matrilin n=1 Tax=Methylomusa anaerophila TaxID=1930071 RepID=A0A348AKK3_9FIRM|nr:hypothetical protein [Methylomusa anaerophila]BBB91601.1 trimeric coiled-coil oligomerisation domain of matrilin [Methylomusa anaerophila]HML89461.1 hypothetical protein [Methylomusa anaerophila]
MTNEEFQKQVLDQLGKISTRLDRMDTRLDSMDTRLDAVDNRLDSMDTRLDAIDSRLDTVDNRLDNLEGQQTENNRFIQVLLHRTEELDAKFDGLLHTTATKEALNRLEVKIDRIAGDVSFLARKSFEHADDIRELKRAR